MFNWHGLYTDDLLECDKRDFKAHLGEYILPYIFKTCNCDHDDLISNFP